MLRKISLTVALIVLVGGFFVLNSENGYSAKRPVGEQSQAQTPRKASSVAAQRNILSGMVTDPQGFAIAGARVRIPGLDDFLLTDELGMFQRLLVEPWLQHVEVFVTAGKEGWLNGGARSNPLQRNIRIILQKVPDFDDPLYQTMITSPISSRIQRSQRDCANCHTTHMWEWGASKMGKTVRNERVLASYKKLQKTISTRQANTCADCHAPIAAQKAPGQTDLAWAFSGGNLSNGIECDFCHKIRDVQVDNRSGVQKIESNRITLGRGMMSPILVSGPYDDTVNMVMAASYNPLYSKSEFCSACHQNAVSLPENSSWDPNSIYPEADQYPLYEDGQVVPDQWTYQEWLEWQNSLPENAENKGQQCQDCHMNWTKNMMPYYRYVVSGNVRRSMGTERSPKSIYPHKFEGATPSRLTGSVNLQVQSMQEEGTLSVQVGVTNVNAGHRLPTGEHSRNMILLVSAEDEDGSPLDFQDGSVVPAWGGFGGGKTDYAGLAGKGFARITVDGNGTINVPVWQAAAIQSDNRIKPAQTDLSEYKFKVPEGRDEEIFFITATLIYRKSFPENDADMGWEPEEIIMKEKTIESGDGGL
jgi:hypothetical protein